MNKNSNTNSEDHYHIRNSFFSLVELSLLAKLYEENCTPMASKDSLNSNSVAQTLLKMKATENQGELRVAIYGEDAIGFYWQYDGKTLAHWVHPEHQGQGVEQRLLAN